MITKNVNQATGRTESRWCGKPLSEFTKEELIQIIEHMESIRRGDNYRHQRDMDLLIGRRALRGEE